MLLSFVAGYVDTVGFVALFGLFTAHVTGNFVLIGASLVLAHKGGIIAKLAALPVFVLAVAATTTFVGVCKRDGKPPLSGVLFGQMVFLGGFAAVGIAASPVTNPDEPLAILAGLLGVGAMGIQNTASRLLMSDLPPTTVMTGGVTQFSIDAMRFLRGDTTSDAAESRRRLVTLAVPVAAFAMGAIAGALIYTGAGFLALLVPILVLMTVLALTRTQSGAHSP